MNKIIEFKNVSFGYEDDHKIVDNLSLEINENEMVAITGVSGSGKSTILALMSMLIKNNDGEIIIDDVTNPEFNTKVGRQLLHDTISMVFQNNLLLETETVLKNLEIYENRSIYSIEEILSMVGLNGYEKKKIYQLSGGEQQRIALARAMVKNSKILLADEPTGNLDQENALVVYQIFREIQKTGKTIVLVTHDIELANKCDRVIKINHLS